MSAAAEPTHPGPAGAARWSAYLEWVREDIAARVLALSAEEQRTSRIASAWTPIELLSHVLHMEQRWFVWGFLGEQVDEPWGDWTDDELGQRWHVGSGVTAEDLADRLTAVGERTRSVLEDFPLDATASPGGRFAEDPPTLEWICFHVLQEYARHAGHLDLAIELGQ